MGSESLGVTERNTGVRDRLRRTGPGLAIAAVIAALGSRFFLIIWKHSINVFFLDQWEYMTPFFGHRPSVAELFRASYFYVLSRPWRGKRSFVLALWILLLLPAAVRKPWEEIRWYSNGKRDWANCYVRTENIHYCDQSANFLLHTPFEEIGLKEKLDYLKRHRLNLFSEADSK